MIKRVSILATLVVLVSLYSFAQSIPDLKKNPSLTAAELDSVSKITSWNDLKPVFYSDTEGYTTNPSTIPGSKIYGCKGDFNNDKVTDYTLIMRDPDQNKDKLTVSVSGQDTVFTLYAFDPLHVIAERNPYSIELNAPQCYRRSESGIFIGLEGREHDMPGDLIRYGWYSYVWDGRNGFTRIITSD